jgi:hypothetical protein
MSHRPLSSHTCHAFAPLPDDPTGSCVELWEALQQHEQGGAASGLLRPGQPGSEASLKMAASVMGLGSYSRLPFYDPQLASLAACCAAAEVGRQGSVGEDVETWLR